MHFSINILCFFLSRVFPTGGKNPTSQKFAHPPPPPLGKIPPPTKFLSPPPSPKVHSPPLNNNFLNGQNYSLSDSHHPIKESPHCSALHCTALHYTALQSPCPLKLFRKLPTKFSVPQPKFHLQPKTNFHVA